jgi:hypothetical protein
MFESVWNLLHEWTRFGSIPMQVLFALMFMFGKAVVDSDHCWLKDRFFHVAQTVSTMGIVLFGVGCSQTYDHWLYAFVVILFGMGAPFEALLSYLNTGKLYGERTRTFPIEFLPTGMVEWIGRYIPVRYFQIRFDGGRAAVIWDVSRVVLVVILGIAGRELL